MLARRRGFLMVGAATLLAGCTTQRHDSATQRPSRGSAGAAAGSPGSAARHVELPPRRRWHPDANDLAPAAKLTAVRLVERRGNTRDAVLQVIDAQYGGLLGDAASVLVVCRTWRRQGGQIREGGGTYDVRVVRAGRAWKVTAVHPSHPGAPAPRLTEPARRVLADRRVELPPAGRADVRSGLVHDSVLGAMLALAGSYRFSVSVVRSGHPLHVFGTDRLSDHPQGRAFDTWRIDGHPVVDRRTPRRLVVGFMEAAAAAGSYNVGGPYLLGAAPQFFSDPTHRDHVHAGFSR